MSEETRLRPVRESDLEVIERIRSEPELASDFAWFGFPSRDRYRREWREDGMLGPDGGTLMVVREDEPLGSVSWRRAWHGPIGHCWNMGITLLPQARGLGHGSRAQRLLVRYLFDNTTVNRVEAATDITNLAEQRALEKAGLTREGVLRGAQFRGGSWHDMVLYGIVRADL